MSKPKVADIVHYVSYGTPGGEYPSVCRAAIVTALSSGAHYEDTVDLCVLNPEGFFFNRLVPHSEEVQNGGTWHWPESFSGD